MIYTTSTLTNTACLGFSPWVKAGKNLQLNPAGEHLFLQACQILAQLSQVVLLPSEGAERRVLRLGTLSHWCLPWPVFYRSWQQHRGAELPQLQTYAELDALQAALATRELELALLPGSGPQQGLRCLASYRSAFVIAQAPQLETSDWQQLRFAAFGPQYQKHNDPWPEAELPRQVVLRCDEFESLRAAALQGGLAVYLPESLIATELAAGQLAVVPEPPCQHWLEVGLYEMQPVAVPQPAGQALE